MRGSATAHGIGRWVREEYQAVGWFVLWLGVMVTVVEVVPPVVVVDVGAGVVLNLAPCTSDMILRITSIMSGMYFCAVLFASDICFVLR